MRRKRKVSRRKLVQLARRFLMWFNRDGSPCDGFRFQEQRQQLSDAVNYEEWQAKRFSPKRKAVKRG